MTATKTLLIASVAIVIGDATPIRNRRQFGGIGWGSGFSLGIPGVGGPISYNSGTNIGIPFLNTGGISNGLFGLNSGTNVGFLGGGFNLGSGIGVGKKR